MISLDGESRIIRREEDSALRQARWWAREHEDGIDNSPGYELYVALRSHRVHKSA